MKLQEFGPWGRSRRGSWIHLFGLEIPWASGPVQVVARPRGLCTPEVTHASVSPPLPLRSSACHCGLRHAQAVPSLSGDGGRVARPAARGGGGYDAFGAIVIAACADRASRERAGCHSGRALRAPRPTAPPRFARRRPMRRRTASSASASRVWVVQSGAILVATWSRMARACASPASARTHQTPAADVVAQPLFVAGRARSGGCASTTVGGMRTSHAAAFPRYRRRAFAPIPCVE